MKHSEGGFVAVGAVDFSGSVATIRANTNASCTEPTRSTTIVFDRSIIQ